MMHYTNRLAADHLSRLVEPSTPFIDNGDINDPYCVRVDLDVSMAISLKRIADVLERSERGDVPPAAAHAVHGFRAPETMQ